MMTSLAHELNQPMSAVLSYAEAAQEILMSSTPDATKRAALPLSKAIAQAQRAAAVIRRMRDFVTHAAPPRRPEDLNTVVVEASALALSGGREDDLRINAQLDENLPMVLIDKAGVQEVAYNLISNAIRAMRGRNGGELTIQTYADAECTEVSVVVSDNGPGLPPEVRARLYQPFMGADQDGYGLGLTIAREIVESHGGRLVADDRPEGGARFKFTLPAATQNAD
jgi:two-component system sensor kinase FixL